VSFVINRKQSCGGGHPSWHDTCGNDLLFGVSNPHYMIMSFCSTW